MDFPRPKDLSPGSHIEELFRLNAQLRQQRGIPGSMLSIPYNWDDDCQWPDVWRKVETTDHVNGHDFELLRPWFLRTLDLLSAKELERFLDCAYGDGQPM